MEESKRKNLFIKLIHPIHRIHKYLLAEKKISTNETEHGLKKIN